MDVSIYTHIHIYIYIYIYIYIHTHTHTQIEGAPRPWIHLFGLKYAQLVFKGRGLAEKVYGSLWKMN